MRRRWVRWLALTFGVLILLAVASFIPTLWLRDPGTVSYTHLDVYKRQARGLAADPDELYDDLLRHAF